MGEKDFAQKRLEDYNDVFADIHNVLVFHEKRMDERRLHRGATESVYKAETHKLREQRRDTFKEYADEENKKRKER